MQREAQQPRVPKNINPSTKATKPAAGTEQHRAADQRSVGAAYAGGSRGETWQSNRKAAAPTNASRGDDRGSRGSSIDRLPVSEFDALAGWGSAAQKERRMSSVQEGRHAAELTPASKRVFASNAEELAFLRSENYRLLISLNQTEQELIESKERHAADLESFSPGQVRA